MQKKAKTAVAAMLTRSREDHLAEDCTLSEEERWEKEQANLVQHGAALGHQISNSYRLSAFSFLKCSNALIFGSSSFSKICPCFDMHHNFFSFSIHCHFGRLYDCIYM